MDLLRKSNFTFVKFSMTTLRSRAALCPVRFLLDLDFDIDTGWQIQLRQCVNRSGA
jgi:hypothetical protein